MTEIKKLLDFDKDGQIESAWLLKLGISKEKLATLGFKIELENVKSDTVNDLVKKYIPKAYQAEILEKKDLKEKEGYVQLFVIWTNLLWKKTIEILAEGDKSLPLWELTTFLKELIEAEEDKNLLETSTIVLTLDEITELKQKIFTENYTRKKLKEFIKEQLNENISSGEAILWTSLAEKLKRNGISPINFVKSFDNINRTFIEGLLGKHKISEDTTYNMGAGISISLFKLFNEGKLNFNSINELKNLLKNKKWEIKENAATLINLFKVLSNITKAIKELNLNNKNSENNELLMNPQLLSDKIVWWVNKPSYKDIKETIKKYQKNEHAKYNKKDIILKLKETFNTTWDKLTDKDIKENKKYVDSIYKANEIIEKAKNWLFHTKQAKEKIKGFIEEHSDIIKNIKSWAEEFKIWDTLKKLLDLFLKFFGFKNGWDDIEKDLNKENLKEVVKYLKNKTNLEEIKNDKDSIFYKGFKNAINDNKDPIKSIKVKGNLSQSVLYYLSSVWAWDYKKNLDKFFKSKNFEKFLKEANIKNENFYKEAFKITTEESNNIKNKIWVINLDKISEIIEKTKEPEIWEIIDKKASTVAQNYPSEINSKEKVPSSVKDKEKIENLIAEEEKKFKKLVEELFPNIKDFSYRAYISSIWYVESRNRYNIKNSIGAVWKYQFMPYTLKDFWIKDPEKFRKNPYLQEKIMAEYTERQLKQIAPKIRWRVANGKDVAFYLAKSHLGWAGAVLKNRSDWNLTQQEYAQNVTNIYKNIA